MIRKLLATTAIVSVASFGGLSAIAQTPQPTPPAAQQPMPAGPAATIEYFDAQDDNTQRASDLIGMTVYGSAANDAETIGEVDDLVVADDGSIDAVVIAVGGFLGVGEKNVAVNYESLAWAPASDGDPTLILATTKEALEAAPTFVYTSEEPAPAADVSATTPAADPAAPAMTAPANDRMAQAPDTTMTPPAATTPTTGPDFAALQPAPVEAVTADSLINTTVYGADDANVGEVNDIVLAADGKVDAVILDVGGFLGMGEKAVAIGFDALEILADSSGNLVLRTDFTQDQLNAAPTYVKEDYQTRRDEMRLTLVKPAK